MKYSKKFNNTYDFYYNWVFPSNFIELFENVDIKFSKNGVSAKQAFYEYESNGYLLDTTEPKILGKLLAAKSQVNLMIKLWAEGLVECTLMPYEFSKKILECNKKELLQMGAKKEKIDKFFNIVTIEEELHLPQWVVNGTLSYRKKL